MAEEQLNESMSSADTLAHFQYRPFQHSDEIRVLQVVLASDDTVFKCKVDFVRLGEDPEYTALSYTCGDADAKYAAVAYKTDVVAKNAIECDGASFMVTNNLHEALCMLHGKHDVTTIWVDQIYALIRKMQRERPSRSSKCRISMQRRN